MVHKENDFHFPFIIGNGEDSAGSVSSINNNHRLIDGYPRD